MSYKFGGCLYDTEYRYLRAIAQEWLAAGGLNSKRDIVDVINKIDPSDLAAKCIDCWFSDELSPSIAPTLDKLSATFAELSADRSWLVTDLYDRLSKKST